MKNISTGLAPSVAIPAPCVVSLLLAEYTGLAPCKRTFELVTLYLQGWVQDHELIRHITRLQQQAVSKKI